MDSHKCLWTSHHSFLSMISEQAHPGSKENRKTRPSANQDNQKDSGRIKPKSLLAPKKAKQPKQCQKCEYKDKCNGQQNIGLCSRAAHRRRIVRLSVTVIRKTYRSRKCPTNHLYGTVYGCSVAVKSPYRWPYNVVIRFIASDF